MTNSTQRNWLIIGGIVTVLAVGAALLVRLAPPRIDVGMRAPDFVATDLTTGKPVSFDADYRGDVTLVNVWATYCIPCREEIPAMDSLYQSLRSRGFRIAAVSIDELPPAQVKAFADQFHISFDVLQDSTGRIEQMYRTTGVPESFLVDRGGRIVRIVQHATAWNTPEVRRIVSDLLGPATGGAAGCCALPDSDRTAPHGALKDG